MKRMCAWCGCELDPAEDREDLPVTHGLCPQCWRTFFASARTPETDPCSTQKEAVNLAGLSEADRNES